MEIKTIKEIQMDRFELDLEHTKRAITELETELKKSKKALKENPDFFQKMYLESVISSSKEMKRLWTRRLKMLEAKVAV